MSASSAPSIDVGAADLVSEAEIELVLSRLSTASVVEADEIVVFVNRASVRPALEAFLASRKVGRA